MALINCPECYLEVSDSSLRCPNCGIQLRKPKRGLFGKLVMWSLIGFNIIMPLLLIISLHRERTEAMSTAEEFGTFIAVAIFIGFWVFVNIILCLFALLTKPNQ